VIAINSHSRIVVHCSVMDEQRCKRIVNQIDGTKYDVELNGKLTDSDSGIKANYVVCCLSSNYENDRKREGEIKYSFKSQHHILPIHLNRDFKPQQLWLNHILELLVTSPIDFSEANNTLSNACDQLHRELSNYDGGDDTPITTPLYYVSIYQECCKQGWHAIPALLLHIHAYLLQTAIDKRLLTNITKLIDLMRILNNHLQGQAQSQIDLFHKWLIETIQERGNYKNQDLHEQQKVQNSPELLAQNSSKEVSCSFICLKSRFIKKLVHF
jgi:hypothetical protein